MADDPGDDKPSPVTTDSPYHSLTPTIVGAPYSDKNSSPSTPITPRPPPSMANALPDGCSFGELPGVDGKDAERVIWVEFPPGSSENPFYFTRRRKIGITTVAIFFTFMNSYTTSAFSISAPSMCDDLHCTTLQVEAGIAVYAYSFSICPMIVAPLSEELGRKWTYVIAVTAFWILNLMMTLGQNYATILISRILLGAAGSVGATIVGGTIADIFIPAHRGLPMAAFAFCAIFGTGLGATTMAFVEADPRLRWRWVWWIQFIILGAFVPIVILVMKETRVAVILRHRAARLRKERGLCDGGRYLARSEAVKVKFSAVLRQSLLRPMTFLVKEPIVMFFSLWVSVGWGVFFVIIAGTPYIFKKIHHFGTIGSGQVYWTMCLGGALGVGANFITERVYRKKAATKGVEARLYAPMLAGIAFAAGCFIVGFTSIPSVHWIAPCVGLTLIITAIVTIYITAFTYLSECYGAYASSAIAAQSFCRNAFGGSFCFFTTAMFERLTVRWALVMMGGIASVLALVPFVAFFYGPQIRARSPFSRQLMDDERQEIEEEKKKREAYGMDSTAIEELEGDADGDSEAMERQQSRAAPSIV